MTIQYHLYKSRLITAKFEKIFAIDNEKGIEYLLHAITKQPNKIKYMTLDKIITIHPELKGLKHEI